MSETVEPLDVRPGDVEGWIDRTGGRFEEAYRYLRSRTGWRPGPCFVGAWLSLHRDDRGTLHTFGELSEWLGVARQTAYKWRADYRLDEWAEMLRLQQLRGEALGEVDRMTLAKALDPEAPTDARRLYYQRAGVLNQEVTISDLSQEQRMEQWLAELRTLEEDA